MLHSNDSLKEDLVASKCTAWRLFEALYPVHHARLACYADGSESQLKTCVTEFGEENLFDARFDQKYYIHNPRSALIEAKEWVSRVLRDVEEKTDILVIYGIGVGWLWKALLPWVERKANRTLYFVEDDLEIIAHFLDSTLGAEFFCHPQSRLIALTGADDKESLDLLCWNLYRKTYRFLVSPAYEQFRSQAVKMVYDTIVVRATDIHLVADEFSSFGLQHARNWIKNLTLLKDAYNAQDLFGAFSGGVAVVCAAGPSLQEALPFLEKWKSQALILTGGSSINALLEAGIIPHAGVTVDPNPLQYSRMKYVDPFHLPLFFRSRALYDGVTATHGTPLLYLRGNDGYPLVTYFEERLEIDGVELDGGDSVATLLIELAVNLGVSTVLMVGYDLGYTDGKRYPVGLKSLLHQDESGIHQKGLVDGSITAISNSGKEIVTESKWVIEGAWIDRFAQSIDHEKVTIVNSSINGLSIPSVLQMSLEDIDRKFFNKIDQVIPISDVFTAKIYSCRPIQQEKPLDEDIRIAFKDLSEALIQFQHKAQEVLQSLQVEKEMKYREKQEALLYDLENSFAYVHLLKPFWTYHLVWKEMTNRLKTFGGLVWMNTTEQEQWNQDVVQRVRFILDAIEAYKKIFFSYVSWAALQGEFFTDPFVMAPWPDGAYVGELVDPASL